MLTVIFHAERKLRKTAAGNRKIRPSAEAVPVQQQSSLCLKRPSSLSVCVFGGHAVCCSQKIRFQTLKQRGHCSARMKLGVCFFYCMFAKKLHKCHLHQRLCVILRFCECRWAHICNSIPFWPDVRSL